MSLLTSVCPSVSEEKESNAEMQIPPSDVRSTQRLKQVPRDLPVLPSSRPPHVPPSFHVLGKPSGAICNLDCAYCFFLSKERLYPGSRFRMSDELLENYIRQLIEAQQGPEVTIAWQGGEPTLMGLDFFRRAVVYGKKYARPGTKLHEVGTSFMQFIPIVERVNEQGETGFQQGNRVTERSVTAQQWGNFLITIFDEWVRRDASSISSSWTI